MENYLIHCKPPALAVGMSKTKCSQCIHADRIQMKCYPKSNDCKSEYDLTEEDFHKEARCDFFQKK